MSRKNSWWETALNVLTAGAYGAGKGVYNTIKTGDFSNLINPIVFLATGGFGGDPLAYSMLGGLAGNDIQEMNVTKNWNQAQANEQAVWRKQYDDTYNEYQNLYNKVKDKYGEEYVDDLFAKSTSSWKSYDDLNKVDANNADLFNADLAALNQKLDALKTLDAANDKTQTTDEISAEKLAGNTEAQTAMSNAQAARNTGINKSRAGALSSTDKFGATYRDSVEGLQSQNVMTQSDYLEKMGYANALDINAANLEKGAGLNTVAAIFQGMSDETEKEDIDGEDSKLDPSDGFDAIAQLTDELEYYDDDDILEQLAQLETIKYQYKNPEKDGEDDEIHLSGFTAQSMQKLPLFKGVVAEIDGDLRISTELLEQILVEKILPAIRNVVECSNK